MAVSTHTSKHGNGNGNGTNGDVAGHAGNTGAPGTSASVRPSTDDEIGDAVASSRIAQEQWRAMPLADRVAALTRAAKEMLRRRREVIDLAHEEMGKVEAEGIFNEALGPLDTVSGWAKIVTRATSQRRVRLNPLNWPKKRAHVDYVPRGVVGVIAPWNYPVAGLYRSLIPALMTGNGVVLKPSEYTPRTSAWLADRFAAEMPEGLIKVVHGDGRAGKALVDAGIDACVFTGSVKAGRIVRVQCTERGIPASIEMGGKDAAIVLADCNLDKAVAGLVHWSLSNAGQACGAIEIAYVDREIADELVKRLARAFEKLRPLADIAPLANARQFDIVVAQVDDARANGAKVVCGGAPGEGLYYPPTLLDDCNDKMAVVRDETFGPVLAIVRVDGAGDGIRRVNKSRYGLGASIWSADIARAERLAEKLDVGIVTINNHGFSGAIPALPWSGTRETGFGIANGPESLGTFVRPRAVVIDESKGPEIFFLPYDKTLTDLGELLADAQIGRILGAWRIPLLMRKRMAALKKFFG